MKRAREEEQGEGQQQEPTQGAPMAASAPRNPSGPVVSAAGAELLMAIFEAAGFVLNVRNEFEPDKFQQFLHVACQLFMGLSIAGFVDGMKPLFRGHPGLTRQLNRFLPTRYKLSEDDNQLPEEVPDFHSLQGSPRPPSVD